MDKLLSPLMATINHGTASPSMPAEVESKVQVDRRRLEAMITGESPGENAEAFFARVERQTGARICWPSRLKIRAKTKKDPFVKLSGRAQAVQKAAEMIGAHLRVKKEKATLKMEISHCLHSQIIGRGGRNTQQIMRDTGCHIHFPDSNKVLSPALAQAKNDQVSISGCAKDVEKAREMLRAIGPLAVSVNIQLALSRGNLGAIQARLDPAILQRHFPLPHQQSANGEVSVQFSQPPPIGPSMFGALHFVMRSSGRNELDMLREFGRICQMIGVFPTGAELFCCSQFEIRPSALPSLSAVRWIAFRTNTQIQLNAQGLLISGPLEGIFVARKFMTGLLPVSLHFEKPPELAAPPLAMLRALERELDVQIGEKRRRKALGTKGAGRGAAAAEGTTTATIEEEREFIVATYEANLFNAYLARNRLLQLNESTGSASGTDVDGIDLQLEDQFPQDNDQAALMRSLCRASLLADQQPSLPPSIPFPTCKTPPFSVEELGAQMANWKEGTIVGGGEKLAAEMDGPTILMGPSEGGGSGPKSPDPEESPIAAGLLAGAKSMNLGKGEFRKALDRERMMLKANQAIFNSPLLDIGANSQEKELATPNSGQPRAPTDFWSGYGFSNSLPAELLRMGRLGGVGGIGDARIWPEGGGKKPKGRPIVGRGAEDKEEGEKGEKQKEKEEKIILATNRVVQQKGELPNFAKSQMLPSREEASMGGASMEFGGSRKATALVHPRVAALQAGEQKKPKFTMSTGSGGLFEQQGGSSSNNFQPIAPFSREQQPIGGTTTMGPSGTECPSASSNSSQQSAKTSNNSPSSIQWDIRALNEPALVLSQLGLAEHIGLFREQEIDMQAFLLLDEQCLGTLGVNTLGARRKIMHAVNKLRESARRNGLYSL